MYVYNIDKNGISGYIGYSVFSEICYKIQDKVQNNKDVNVYLYKMLSKECACYDEINRFIKLGYVKIYEK